MNSSLPTGAADHAVENDGDAAHRPMRRMDIAFLLSASPDAEASSSGAASASMQRSTDRPVSSVGESSGGLNLLAFAAQTMGDLTQRPPVSRITVPPLGSPINLQSTLPTTGPFTPSPGHVKGNLSSASSAGPSRSSHRHWARADASPYARTPSTSVSSLVPTPNSSTHLPNHSGRHLLVPVTPLGPQNSFSLPHTIPMSSGSTVAMTSTHSPVEAGPGPSSSSRSGRFTGFAPNPGRKLKDLNDLVKGQTPKYSTIAARVRRNKTFVRVRDLQELNTDLGAEVRELERMIALRQSEQEHDVALAQRLLASLLNGDELEDGYDEADASMGA